MVLFCVVGHFENQCSTYTVTGALVCLRRVTASPSPTSASPAIVVGSGVAFADRSTTLTAILYKTHHRCWTCTVVGVIMCASINAVVIKLAYRLSNVRYKKLVALP